jgi:acyl CoA:acetate/3-ketoacid CoA transferase beta subunit
MTRGQVVNANALVNRGLGMPTYTATLMRNAANVPYMFYVTDSRQDTVVHLHVTE